MSKHTEGPWIFRETMLQDGHGGIKEKSVVHYRNEVPHNETKDEYICREIRKDADARLIAAAPELLAACEALVAWDKSHGDTTLISNACSWARTAVRKATGKEAQ